MSKKVMVINFPVAGNIYPIVDLCKELSKKNVKLIIYTLEKYFSEFENNNNIELRKYPDNIVEPLYKMGRERKECYKLLAFFYVYNVIMENNIEYIMDEVAKEKPDMILCDIYALWGKIAARYFKIPMALFCSTFLGNAYTEKHFPRYIIDYLRIALTEFEYIIKSRKIVARIEKKYGKVTDNPINYVMPNGNFCIVTTSREFHPKGESYPENVKFMGPVYDKEILDNEKFEKQMKEKKENKDTIFISLGTIFSNAEFWDICNDIAKETKSKIAVSFGGNSGNKSSRILPDNVTVYDNLYIKDYWAVLKRSKLFISHGGFNSLYDAIIYEVPILVCPQTIVQVVNGEYVKKCGCGEIFKEDINTSDAKKKIFAMMNNLIDNDEVKKNIKRYKESFLNSMGYKKVVEELIREFDL